MLPLEGIRVLDLTRLVPGPYATMILADFGAEVIKIEQPGIGDYAREFEPKMKKESAIFYMFNRNKKSITLDLKKGEDKNKFIELAKTSDVIIEGFRPGVMDRLGLGYDRISEINPRIIWCSISGFGKESPYKHMPGHDINYVGLGGILDLTGYERPAVLGTQLADIGSALWAVIGILLALRERDKTGKGDFIDVSMFDTVISWLGIPLAEYIATGIVPKRRNTWSTGATSCYDVYEVKDGFVTIAGLEEKFWIDIMKAIGREDLIPYQNSREKWVKEEIEKTLKQFTIEEIERLAREKGLCMMPVKDISQVLEDPHVKMRELIWEIEIEEEGKVKTIAPPIKFGNIKPIVKSPPPEMGEHNEEFFK
ncbi:MAG: CaiB/BaiF CoA transferase family protein [Thermosulfidibacteraceae bacterium]|jgi:crotonobetainyl-CoA:carnitine CoA-transferase CaiB-like acyl-CoA transferase